MSLLSNGNEIHQHSYVFPMNDASQVGEARRFALRLGNCLEFDDVRKGRIGIIVNELGNNLVRYAKGGEILFRRTTGEEGQGIEILALDRGPGLDIPLVMHDGFTTGATPGTGLGAVRRQSDEFDIYSLRDSGTVILSKILIEKGSASVRGFDIGAVSVPLVGESVCGDSWSIRRDGDRLAAIVVDGLGHGPLANRAALEAIDVFQTQNPGQLNQLMQSIHTRLKGTRGGAVFLTSASHDIIEYAGVGNIRGLVHLPTQTKSLISQNGTAGIQIRTVRALSDVWPGEGFLILHSDGVMSRWNLAVYPGIFTSHPSILAAVIYRDFLRGNDDATVLVIRRRR